MSVDRASLTALFQEVDPEVLRELEQSGFEIDLDQGEALFRQGAKADGLYFVLTGALEVVSETASGSRLQLEIVPKGGWIGEMNLIDSRPRGFSVFAIEPTCLLRLPIDVCHQLIAAHPNVKQRLLDAAFRRRPSHHLRAMPLFAGVDPEALTKLDHLFKWVSLPSGETVCRQGDPTDAVFIVINGCLETLVLAEEGEKLINIMERGAAIGEVGALTGEPRSATVRAIRDSDLIGIERAHFLQLLNEQPQIAVNFARMLAQRLRRITLVPRLTPTVRAIAVISATASPIPEGFVEQLAATFEGLNVPARRIGSREVNAELGAGSANAMPSTDAQHRLIRWLDAQQLSYRVIIYECDADASVWTVRALRQADLILMVSRAEESPVAGPIDAAGSRVANFSRIRRELVLLHKNGNRPRATDRWLRLRTPARHHHVRAGNAGDFARLGRSIIGLSVGVALSGGGARGFAHIGLVKALHQRGIPVDVIGGTSMGSVVAAQVALGWDVPTMIERNRRAFLEWPVFRDLTFPYVSLMKGSSTVDLLQGMFGDTQIEDMWLPYFCVSTNLSRAQVVVHERGPLWLWVRSSSSVPGIGPPVPCNGDLLVDGGLLNNLPVDILRRRCGGPLIASDAGASIDLKTELDTRVEMSGWAQLGHKLNPWSKAADFPNVFEILLRCTGMSSDQSLEQGKRTADLYLRPQLDSVGSIDWAAIERAVEIGYRHACERIDAWENMPAVVRPMIGRSGL